MMKKDDVNKLTRSQISDSTENEPQVLNDDNDVCLLMVSILKTNARIIGIKARNLKKKILIARQPQQPRQVTIDEGIQAPPSHAGNVTTW